MRNRTITNLLLAIVLLLFFAYFICQSMLYQSGQTVVNRLDDIIEYAQQDKWPEAQDSANRLEDYWKKAKYFLALNYAEEDYSLFMDNISRIHGAIKTKDVAEAVSLATAATNHWNNFIKVIPQP